jgi:hypothetical protein
MYSWHHLQLASLAHESIYLWLVPFEMHLLFHSFFYRIGKVSETCCTLPWSILRRMCDAWFFCDNLKFSYNRNLIHSICPCTFSYFLASWHEWSTIPPRFCSMTTLQAPCALWDQPFPFGPQAHDACIWWTQELRVVPNFRASTKVFDFQFLTILHFYFHLYLRTWTHSQCVHFVMSFCRTWWCMVCKALWRLVGVVRGV